MNYPAFPVNNGFAPAQGPRAMPVTLDFTSVARIEFDLQRELHADTIGFIQCVYVDNTDNAAALVLRFTITNQRLVVPAGASGIWPVIAPSEGMFVVATTTAAAENIVYLTFLNVPMPLTQWGPMTVNVANVTATFTPTVGVAADNSGTVAAGGTSQALFAANAAAIRRIVSNPVANIEPLFINFGGAAAGAGDSIPLLPGQTFDTGTGPIDQTAWTINNLSVNGQPYVAKEFA